MSSITLQNSIKFRNFSPIVKFVRNNYAIPSPNSVPNLISLTSFSRLRSGSEGGNFEGETSSGELSGIFYNNYSSDVGVDRTAHWFIVFILFIDSRVQYLIISRIQRPLGLHPFSPCDVMWWIELNQMIRAFLFVFLPRARREPC